MSRARLLSIGTIFTTTLGLAACGAVEPSGASPPPADASVQDARIDAPSSEATTSFEAGALDAVAPRCATDAPSPSPSGAPCDWSRIVSVPSVANTCVTVGSYCDSFTFGYSLQDAQPLDDASAAPFSCRTELGVRGCDYVFEGGAGGYLDNAALDAACRITQLLPDVTIRCVVSL